MKTLKFILFSTLIVSFSLVAIFQLSSCTEAKSQILTSNIHIDDLLQRSEKIQNGKEWDYVQNQYNDLKNAILSNPDDNESKLRLAQLYIKEARVTGEHGHYYPAALSILEKALDNRALTDDLKFLVLTTKAGVQLSLHEFSEALQTGNDAAMLNPTNAQIHGVLVDANVELGNYDKAVKLADRMISIKPDIRSYSRVSYLREIFGDMQGSIDAMTMAVKSGFPGTEETAWAMLTLGELYIKNNDLDKAKNVLQQSLKMRPDYPFAVAALGDIQYLEGDLAGAESTYKKAMNNIPEVGFYISLAQLYKDQNRLDEMQPLLEEILVMLEDDTQSGHNMNLEYASLYLDLIEDKEKAMQYAQLELGKRPQNKDVIAMVSKIENSK